MRATAPFIASANIIVGDSPGKGRGVFATRRIGAGQVIEIAPVVVIPPEQLALLGASFLGSYLFRTNNKRHVILGLGLASMVNHDAAANAEFSVTAESITIKALRAISTGTEVTIDYQWDAGSMAAQGMLVPKANEL